MYAKSSSTVPLKKVFFFFQNLSWGTNGNNLEKKLGQMVMELFAYIYIKFGYKNPSILTLEIKCLLCITKKACLTTFASDYSWDMLLNKMYTQGR